MLTARLEEMPEGVFTSDITAPKDDVIWLTNTCTVAKLGSPRNNLLDTAVS